MNAQPTVHQPASATANWPRQLLAVNAPLALVGLSMLLLLVGALVGLAVDPRVITGAPAWLKPAKFAISLAIYSFTFLWLLRFVPGRPRLVGLAGAVTALMFVVEMAIIVVQAARGTTSHFNAATPLDAALFSAMGAAIVAVWLMGLVLAVLLFRQRQIDPAFAWSLRLAVVISLVGMALAFLMTSPTSAQLAAARAGQGLPVAGAHAVGVPDGGPGLPIVGWSTTGGDLRVPHFVGLHAMQLLPLLGWWLQRRHGWLGARRRQALVWTASLAYLGLVLLLTWQAVRGQPVSAPATVTLGAAAALAITTGLTTLTIIRRARSS